MKENNVRYTPQALLSTVSNNESSEQRNTKKKKEKFSLKSLAQRHSKYY